MSSPCSDDWLQRRLYSRWGSTYVQNFNEMSLKMFEIDHSPVLDGRVKGIPLPPRTNQIGRIYMHIFCFVKPLDVKPLDTNNAPGFKVWGG